MSILTRRVLAFLTSLPQSFSFVLLLSACLFSVAWMCRPVGTQAQDASATPAQAVPALEVGKPIERELAGGQTHSYMLTLEAEKYFEVTVEQRGVDVMLKLHGPDGKRLTNWNQESRQNGLEKLQWVTGGAGMHTLEISTVSKGAKPGRYSINWSAVRQPTPRERTLTQARILLRDATGMKEEGKFDEALTKVEVSVALFEKELGPEAPEIVPTLNTLGQLYEETGKTAQAEQFHLRALQICEKAFGEEHPAVASAINELAVYYRHVGEYDKAEPLYLRALAIREKLLDPDHPDLARSYNNLGVLYNNKNDYPKSESFYLRALTVYKISWGEDHPDYARAAINLAAVYRDKGDYVKAGRLAEQATATLEKALGAEHPDVAESLTLLASLYSYAGDGLKAEATFQRSLKIIESALGPEHPYIAYPLYNFASFYIEKQDYRKATPLLLRSLPIFEKTFGPDHPEVAASLTALAHSYFHQGDYAKAESLYQRALKIREKALGSNHPDVAEVLDGLSSVYCARNEPARAAEFLARQLEINEVTVRRNLGTSAERQKLAYLSKFADSVNSAVSLQTRFGASAPQTLSLTLTAMLRFKGRGLDEISDTVSRLRRQTRPEDRKLFDELMHVRSQLATLTLRGPDERNLDSYGSQLQQLADQEERLQTTLSERSEEFRTTTLPITHEAVIAAIPDNAALLEFVRYRPVEAKTGKQLAPHYVVYVLTARGKPRWAELGTATAIDEAVEQLRLALRNPNRRDYRRLARVVDKQVMEPVRKLIGEKTQLLLSPDGMLNLLPFAALVDESGKYLLERYKLTYLTSGRDLLRLQIKQESKSAAVVLADPAFDGQPAAGALAQRDIKPVYGGPQSGVLSIDFANAKFNPLPGTAGEAQALKRLLPEAQMLTRERATEAALKQVSRPRLLHIATHGFFLPDLKLNAGEARGGEAVSSKRLENPLLRSGLALAGANQHNKSGDDDGVLTALEAAGLDLWGTKLVVLSACDTGVGEIKNGEGVYGLRRAFVLAGSETQVMSVWSVSDQGTKELMVEYYKRLLRGEGRGEALRQVQLQMLRLPNRRHPYYWASFIQSGEWANLDGKR